MAPEKLLGHDVDESLCDIYALGVTLYKAVTLAHPFAVPKHLPRPCLPSYLASATPPRPSVGRPWLAGPLEAIILRAIDRDPGSRYPSAGAMANDLERFLAGVPSPPRFGDARNRRAG